MSPSVQKIERKYRVIGSSVDRLIGKTAPPGIRAEHKREPEARYAYYRRCQHFRRNGEQCKAPAMKGESICYRHAEQADNEARREGQRRGLLATPGLGFASFRAVQRTIGAVAQALLDDRIDRKTAGRLANELQTASKLLWQQHLLSRKYPLNHKPLKHRGHGATRRREEFEKKEPTRNEEKQWAAEISPRDYCRSAMGGGNEEMEDLIPVTKSPVETRHRRVFVAQPRDVAMPRLYPTRVIMVS